MVSAGPCNEASGKSHGNPGTNNDITERRAEDELRVANLLEPMTQLPCGSFPSRIIFGTEAQRSSMGSRGMRRWAVLFHELLQTKHPTNLESFGTRREWGELPDNARWPITAESRHVLGGGRWPPAVLETNDVTDRSAQQLQQVSTRPPPVMLEADDRFSGAEVNQPMPLWSQCSALRSRRNHGHRKGQARSMSVTVAELAR